jgi:enamine deaminase RidA (YjgF/YER057c/UK114 family)
MPMILLPMLGLAFVLAGGPAEDSPRFRNPPTLPEPHGYSQLVEVPAGMRLIFLSGQVALDRSGRLVGAGDLEAQAAQVFENIRLALADSGASFADVVKLTFYVLDTSQLPALRRVRDRFISTSKPPASTLVQVRGLFRDDVLLEVEAVAAVGNPAR